MQHKKSIRILSFFSAVVLISVCCIPAFVSAVDLNYMDYLTNVRVDGELNNVTASFPFGFSHQEGHNQNFN